MKRTPTRQRLTEQHESTAYAGVGAASHLQAALRRLDPALELRALPSEVGALLLKGVRDAPRAG